MLTNLFNNHISIFTVSFITLIFSLEGLFRLNSENAKKYFIILISSLVILYFDPISFVILSTLSSVTFLIIQKGFKLKKNIYPLSLICIFFLIIIKDYRYVFKLENSYIPLGISYYYFRLLSLIIDYSNRPKEFKSIKAIDFFTWIFFLPIFFAGPIHRLKDFKTVIYNSNQRNKAYITLIFALLIKFIVVDFLLFKFGYVFLYKNLNSEIAPGPLLAYLYGITTFLHAFIDLLTYTYISQMIACLLGYSYVQNFNRPLFATNISSFWNSYHMSLSSWTRDYIFFPTLIKTKKTWVSTYASMMVMGIWHAATLNWVIWAVFHASAINFYAVLKRTKIYRKLNQSKKSAKLLSLSGNFITISFVGIVFIFVSTSNFEEACAIFLKVFGF